MLLIARQPGDACAYHNLGTLKSKAERFDEAVSAYERSIALRPNFALSYLTLGHALEDRGRIDEAISAWQHTLRLAPNNPVAIKERSLLATGEFACQV
jgi:tetratricopeptide (TPR) repeat protein